MKRVCVVSATLLLLPLSMVGCSGSKSGTGFESAGTAKGSSGTGGAGGGGGAGDNGGGPELAGGDAGQANDGDCNDCDPNVNPGAFDVPADGKDEDCNGKVDDDGAACDASLQINSTDAMDAARALGLCKSADAKATGRSKTWGVLSANYVLPDGTPLPDPIGHGLLGAFGVNKPQEGAKMLALSSGTARAPTDPGYQDVGGWDKGYTSGTPAGYPKESPACRGITTGEAHDGAALELTIRVPTNAKSFTFDQNFFTYEFPLFICSEYNDFYVAMMTPQVPHLPDGNIAFDQDGNPVSVNNSLLQVCVPQTIKGKKFTCPLGPSTLVGTGFDHAAATGWLQTTAPVKAGDTITLRLAIWDSGDGSLDSTVLVDKFAWSANEASGPTTTPAPTR
jgi:hypothetical protein